MKYRFSIRNTGKRWASLELGGKLRRWSEDPPFAGRRVRVKVLRWSSRSRGIPPCVSGEACALKRFILELRGHLRWWSYGAFGSKGRLEGGQYLAGRRAPPLLHG